MIKLEHSEAMMLLNIIEANQFSGKNIPALAKLIGKLQRELQKTAPQPDTDVTEEWVDPTDKTSGGSF